MTTTQAASTPPATRTDRVAATLRKERNARLLYLTTAALTVVGGIVFFLVVRYVLPEAGDLAGTISFYEEYGTIAKVVLFVIALAAPILVAGLGMQAAFFWSTDTSPLRVLSWVAVVSDIVFVTTMFLEASLAVAPVLLYGSVPNEIVHALHVLPFASAYILGVVWVPNLVATMALGNRTGNFPWWLNVLGTLGIVGDFLAVFAVTTLYGPLNGANGFVAFFLPGFLPAAWLAMLTAWTAVTWATRRTAGPQNERLEAT